MVVGCMEEEKKEVEEVERGLGLMLFMGGGGEGQRGACLAYFISPPFFGILLYLGTFVMWERGRTKDKVCTAAFTLSRRAVLYKSCFFSPTTRASYDERGGGGKPKPRIEAMEVKDSSRSRVTASSSSVFLGGGGETRLVS